MGAAKKEREKGGFLLSYSQLTKTCKTRGLRAIELADFHCTNHVNCIDTSHSIAHNHLNPMMMAVGPVITHKKSNNIRISYGPKVKALGLYLA